MTRFILSLLVATSLSGVSTMAHADNTIQLQLFDPNPSLNLSQVGGDNNIIGVIDNGTNNTFNLQQVGSGNLIGASVNIGQMNDTANLTTTGTGNTLISEQHASNATVTAGLVGNNNIVDIQQGVNNGKLTFNYTGSNLHSQIRQ